MLCDVLSKGNFNKLIERNEKIQELINSGSNEPFPYVNLYTTPINYGYAIITGFVHYKLDRTYTDIPTTEMIISTLKWLNSNLWRHSNPYVHGDLTVDNIIVNLNKLWIIDYEPGLFQKLTNTNYSNYLILIDLYDFGTTLDVYNIYDIDSIVNFRNRLIDIDIDPDYNSVCENAELFINKEYAYLVKELNTLVSSVLDHIENL